MQQALRAGRDGRGATCILYYSPTDTQTLRGVFVDSNKLIDKATKEMMVEQLTNMMEYCTSTTCRKSLLFGLESQPDDCSCCNCKKKKNASIVDIPLTGKFAIIEAILLKMPSSFENTVRVYPDVFNLLRKELFDDSIAPAGKAMKKAAHEWPHSLYLDIISTLAHKKVLALDNGMVDRRARARRGAAACPQAYLRINRAEPGGHALYDLIYLGALRPMVVNQQAKENDVWRYVKQSKATYYNALLDDAMTADLSKELAEVPESVERRPGVRHDSRMVTRMANLPFHIRWIIDMMQSENMITYQQGSLVEVIKHLEQLALQQQSVEEMEAYIKTKLQESDQIWSKVIASRGKKHAPYMQYSVELSVDDLGKPAIRMLLPVPCRYKRAFQKFGDERFVYAKIPGSMRCTERQDVLEDLLSNHVYQIAGRSYSFWRPHNPYEQDSTCMLFAEDETYNRRDLHEWHIKPTPSNKDSIGPLGKYNARFNLALSDTVFVRTVNVATEVVSVPDIQTKGEDDDSVHNDGLILIPEKWFLEDKAALEAKKHFSGSQARLQPSGKGSCIYAPVDKMMIPASAIKFDLVPDLMALEFNTGGIYSTLGGRYPKQGSLCRQWVSMLQRSGVPAKVFLELQKEFFEKVRLAFRSADGQTANARANELFDSLGGGQTVALSEDTQEKDKDTDTVSQNLFACGFRSRSIEMRHKLWEKLNNMLKSKDAEAKACLPLEQSFYVPIISDPTRTLKKGTFVLKVTGGIRAGLHPQDKRQLAEGETECVLFKSPGYEGAEVRRYTAVEYDTSLATPTPERQRKLAAELKAMSPTERKQFATVEGVTDAEARELESLSSSDSSSSSPQEDDECERLASMILNHRQAMMQCFARKADVLILPTEDSMMTSAAHEMGGADLDGDKVVVCFDARVVEHVQSLDPIKLPPDQWYAENGYLDAPHPGNVPAADLMGDIDKMTKALRDFTIHCMCHEQGRLGQIANIQQRWADYGASTSTGNAAASASASAAAAAAATGLSDEEQQECERKAEVCAKLLNYQVSQ